MLLCLDVGNTHILGGVFDKNKIILRFRYATHLIGTSDQFGIFLISILQANNINPEKITGTAISSVVPSHDYTLQHTLGHYFKTHCFILRAENDTGLKIKYKNPHEVGADRIANAIGANAAFPHKDIIIIDMGTATTLDVVTKQREYLGGAILPGIRLSMESLKTHTAKLMEVDISSPDSYLGRTTKESIQSGLFYGHLGAIKEIIAGLQRELANDEPFLIIGTGGFSQLYRDKALFDEIIPDLVLQGLNLAYHYHK